MELKAPVEGSVHAVVVEAHMNKGLGPVATVLAKIFCSITHTL